MKFQNKGAGLVHSQNHSNVTSSELLLWYHKCILPGAPHCPKYIWKMFSDIVHVSVAFRLSTQSMHACGVVTAGA
jgi:hypothetical protein